MSDDVNRLLYSGVAPGSPYHAAYVSLSPGSFVSAHNHDFYELMLVVEGTGAHDVNGQALSVCPGTLALIRPDDKHALVPITGGSMAFLNVAFPPDPWLEFLALSRTDAWIRLWAKSSEPPQMQLISATLASCRSAFEQILHSYVEGATSLNLCSFWGTILPVLMRAAVPEAALDEPPWLESALQEMRRPENLAAGVGRFAAIAGVTPSHLARTLRAKRGESPTQFVNNLRIGRSAILLSTTGAEISEIAWECGFESLSYFYRLFVRRYGVPPRLFRDRACRLVAP